MSSLLRDAARMFCVGFPEPSPSADVLELIDTGVAGVILFKRNIEDPRQVAELNASLKEHAKRPLLTSLDQEGGRVRRLREPFTPVPPMRTVGESGDPGLARMMGAILGGELRAVNVDLDYAPVMDVDTNPANPVIGDRSFGADPELVAKMGVALIEGMQGAGVAACAKHFPGHGDTSQDSHVDLPRLPHALDRLEAIELHPFRAAVKANVASIMTAHVVFEPLDPELPATMSRPALDGILRDQLGYDGVVISDDLEMKAIAEHFGLEDAVVKGANAGVDLFLVCHHAEVQRRAIEILVKAVERGDVPRARVEQANRRVDALLAKYAKPAVAFRRAALASAAAMACVERVAAKAEQGRDPTEV